MSPPAEPASPELDPKKRKKKDKVRGAWISFIGRIVAQIVGAVASVVLAVLVLQRYQEADKRPSAATESTASRPTRVASARRGGEVALAVLPLNNFSGDRQEDYFAEGMTEALTADLARLEGLRVISRTSTMRYRGQEKTIPEIARELDVDVIVEGSVVKAGDRVRVTAQLIDGQSDEHLWARSYDRLQRDVLTLQGEIAAAIAREVKGTLTARQEQSLGGRRAVDPAVYDLYLRGRQAWNLRTAEGFKQALEFFEHAIQRDPSFALAHAGLADTHNLGGTTTYGGVSVGDPLANARASAERALALDPNLAEAHTSLAWVFQRRDWNWAEAERHYRRAIELNPGYITAHQWYAIFLAEQRRDDEARSHAERAVALDPLSATMHMTLGIVHYYAGRHDSALTSERKARELDPHSVMVQVFLARALIGTGNPRAAIEVLEHSASKNNPEVLAMLGYAAVAAGERARATAIRDQMAALKPAPVSALTRLHAALGDSAATLALLERAVADRYDVVVSLKADPLYDFLRGNPRFKQLLRQVQLT